MRNGRASLGDTWRGDTWQVVEEEDDWDAIQDELRKLTRRCQQESEAREKAELLLNEMKQVNEIAISAN